MKFFIFTSISFLMTIANASTVSVVGPCSETPVFISENVQHDEKITLGELTVQIFEKNQIPFVGSVDGITAILNSPQGGDAIEKLSQKEFRLYGWCVNVNGVDPAAMPNEVIIEKTDSEIIWYYAYATALNGQWTEMCVPSHTKKSLKICQQ
jgi:hypothetical protein